VWRWRHRWRRRWQPRLALRPAPAVGTCASVIHARTALAHAVALQSRVEAQWCRSGRGADDAAAAPAIKNGRSILAVPCCPEGSRPRRVAGVPLQASTCQTRHNKLPLSIGNGSSTPLTHPHALRRRAARISPPPRATATAATHHRAAPSINRARQRPTSLAHRRRHRAPPAASLSPPPSLAVFAAVSRSPRHRWPRHHRRRGIPRPPPPPRRRLGRRHRADSPLRALPLQRIAPLCCPVPPLTGPKTPTLVYAGLATDTNPPVCVLRHRSPLLRAGKTCGVVARMSRVRLYGFIPVPNANQLSRMRSV
jgi:hypothetical protein